MWKIKDSIIKRIYKQFIETGGEGINSRLYDNLPNSTRDEIKSFVSMLNDETPLIVSYLEERYFVLLTTVKLYWSYKGNINSIMLNELKDATVNLNPLDLQTKNQINILKIVTITDTSFCIELEEGKPLFGLWNVLKLIASLKK